MFFEEFSEFIFKSCMVSTGHVVTLVMQVQDVTLVMRLLVDDHMKW